jgi:LasA protease
MYIHSTLHTSSHRALVLIMLLLSLVVAGGVSPLASIVHAQSEVTQQTNIKTAVIKAITHLKGAPPAHGAFVDTKRISDDSRWAFGSIALLTPKQENPRDAAESHRHDEIPEGRLWLARQTPTGWEAAIDSTPVFDAWLQEAPSQVVSTEEQALLGSASAEAASTVGMAADTVSSGEAFIAASLPANKLSLPWKEGQRWKLSGGPHGWGGTARPWSALDFAGGDGQVHAARSGLVYKPCGNTTWVQVRHGEGWVTDYYHLTSIPRFTDGTKIKRGQYLGKTGTAVACGGSAYGAHVHFNVRYKGAHIAWHGQKLGGWTIYEGAKSYQGYAAKNGTRVYPGQLLYNDGN